MFDIAWSEIAVIAVVALVVIGPKDLPKALYTAGKWVRSARKVAAEFQRHVDDMMREAELEDLKKNLQQARDFNLKQKLEQTIDPHGELKGAFDPTAGSDLPMKPGWTKPGLEPPAGKAPAAVPPAAPTAAPVAAPAAIEPPPAASPPAVPASAPPTPAASPPAAAASPEARRDDGPAERPAAARPPGGSDQTARG